MCNTCLQNPCDPCCPYDNLNTSDKAVIQAIETILNLPAYLTVDEGGMVHLCIGDNSKASSTFPFPFIE